MSYTIKRQEQTFDEQTHMCSVMGCGHKWSVHVSGQKPKCSKHQWGKTEQEFLEQKLQHVKKSAYPIPKTPVSESWWNKEEL